MLNPNKYPSPPHSERQQLHFFLKKKTIKRLYIQVLNTRIIMAVPTTRHRKLQNTMRKSL